MMSTALRCIKQNLKVLQRDTSHTEQFTLVQTTPSRVAAGGEPFKPMCLFGVAAFLCGLPLADAFFPDVGVFGAADLADFDGAGEAERSSIWSETDNFSSSDYAIASRATLAH